jgi:3-deoxy-manno-octulosonate cytidylyltransferase (CMP-KDO synthetase)
VPEKRTVIGVIPARYGSTRFPGKPLALIAGKPMIRHVYERALRSNLLSQVIVATDDERIRRAVEEFGGQAMMTAADHATGTDRVAEVAGRLKASHYVNVQGDEPLIEPIYIDHCARLVLEGAPMSTLATRIRWRSELFDQNVVKLITDSLGYAICFSRSPIPFPRKYLDRGMDVDLDCTTYLRHVGVYGYSLASLRTLASVGECEPEGLESLEQLRALVAGLKIRVMVVDALTPCVDVPADLRKVEDLLGAKEGA